MATHDTITLEFNEHKLVVTIKVDMPIGEYEASNNTKYPGYAIVGGKATFEGGRGYADLAPQSVNPYNVMWANANCGNGGSQDGIDASGGIVFTGDNGYLAWNGQNNSFHFSAGGLNADVTLKDANNWPPAQ